MNSEVVLLHPKIMRLSLFEKYHVDSYHNTHKNEKLDNLPEKMKHINLELNISFFRSQVYFHTASLITSEMNTLISAAPFRINQIL